MYTTTQQYNSAVSAQSTIKSQRPAWLTTGVQIITPETAQEMLSTSIGNRQVSNTEVKRLAAIMTNGQWIYNGSAITFDVNGKLTNGHHRLTACVLAKTFFKTLVVVGVEEDARFVDDTHRPKSAADLLAFSMPEAVKPYGTRLMSAYAMFMMYRNETLVMPNRSVVARYAHDTHYSCVSSDTLLKMKVSTIARYTSLLVAFEGIVRGSIDERAYQLSAQQYDVNLGLLHQFIEQLLYGQNMQSGSAVYTLRERLLRNESAPGTIGNRMRFIRACISAYNNYVVGKPISKIVVNLAPAPGASFDFLKPRIVEAAPN